MYSEILKIIEGGLSKNSRKVYEYSERLADKLKEDGQEQIFVAIKEILSSNYQKNVVLDKLDIPSTKEKLDLAEVSTPSKKFDYLVLEPTIQNKVDKFINRINHHFNLNEKGIEIKNHLMLYGPSGCGKTTIARYISYRASLPLVTPRLDTVISSNLGTASKNIRKLFDFVEAKSCILFLDEFDAIAKARDSENESGELKRVITSLLQNIDDLNENTVLIAATNHPHLLDKAVWRRFNTVIEVTKLNPARIKLLLRNYLNKLDKNLIDDSKKIEVISNLLIDKSPAEIFNILQNAYVQSGLGEDQNLNFYSILEEIFESDRHGEKEIGELVVFLNTHGITQKTISDKLGISLRQVRNHLDKVSA